jgi:hypothetical protein
MNKPINAAPRGAPTIKIVLRLHRRAFRFSTLLQRSTSLIALGEAAIEKKEIADLIRNLADLLRPP